MGGPKQKVFKNEFIEEGETVKILLPDGTFALIDKKNYKYVIEYNWYYFKNKHIDIGVIAMEKGQMIRLHSLLAPYFKVEHISGDKRDCRMANMRKYSHPQLRKNHKGTENLGKSRFLKVRSKPRHFEIVKRFTTNQGEKKQIRFCFFFKPSGKNPCKYKNKTDALKAAEEKLKEISLWTKEQIAVEYEARKSSRTKIGDIISDWSLWENLNGLKAGEFHHLTENHTQGYRISS